MSQPVTAASAPLTVDENDGRELLRIAHVVAKEWLRSGRRPPGVPHRKSLLDLSAAWLRLRFGDEERDALQLAGDQPLWEAVSHLAVRLIGYHPSPTPEALREARWQLLVLGQPLPLAVEQRGDLDGLRGCHLAVELEGRARLLPAGDAAACGWDPVAHLGACCRALGHDGNAWRAPEARIHAFRADEVRLHER